MKEDRAIDILWGLHEREKRYSFYAVAHYLLEETKVYVATWIYEFSESAIPEHAKELQGKKFYLVRTDVICNGISDGDFEIYDSKEKAFERLYNEFLFQDNELHDHYIDCKSDEFEGLKNKYLKGW